MLIKSPTKAVLLASAALALPALAAPPAQADHCVRILGSDDHAACAVMEGVVYPTFRQVNDTCLFEHPLLRVCDLYVRDIAELPEGEHDPAR
jgi:hypothetical protein